MFNENILTPLITNIKNNPDANAFYIDERYYSYSQFGNYISKIRFAITQSKNSNNKVGLVINDDIETYASIIALWLDGNCYVPLHPNWPLERCQDICDQVEIDLVIDSSKESRFNTRSVIKSSSLVYDNDCLEPKKDISDDSLAYILFTSGSTGSPKGVQLSRGNLSSFVDAFLDIYKMDYNDRCLQCFDLSFDLSIMSYCVPLTVGACVYTVSPNVVKYTYIGALIEEERLSFALMTPSTIKYLKPFFGAFDCTSLKYSLFCGEPLPLDITKEWSVCAKNAIIDNVYGPTEDTIFCSIYRYCREGMNKEHNGILSIGKPMKNCGMVIFDEDNNECSIGEMGELCLSGSQLTIGYFKNEEKNKEAFFVKDGVRWYKSGDLCYMDEDGDIMYSGRLDHQVKIQGWRIELGEIEYHARIASNRNVVCLVSEKGGNEMLCLVIEGEEIDTFPLIEYMKSKMPSYMIPNKILFMPVFPLNNSDKVDRPRIKNEICNL